MQIIKWLKEEWDKSKKTVVEFFQLTSFLTTVGVVFYITYVIILDDVCFRISVRIFYIFFSLISTVAKEVADDYLAKGKTKNWYKCFISNILMVFFFCLLASFCLFLFLKASIFLFFWSWGHFWDWFTGKK